MNKNTLPYVTPTIEVVACIDEEPLAAGSVYSDDIIDYGGIDTSGQHEVSSRLLEGIVP